MLNMEKRIDAFIHASKNQELKEAECGDEIDRFLAQAAHIAELHIGESGIDLGEQHLGQIMSVDYDLDTFIAGVGHAKQALALAMNDPGELCLHRRIGNSKLIVFTVTSHNRRCLRDA